MKADSNYRRPFRRTGRYSKRSPGVWPLAAAASVVILISVPLVMAQSSSNYSLKGSIVNNGGAPVEGLRPTSASFRLQPATIGEPIAGSSSSPSFELDAGFAALDLPEVIVEEPFFADGFESGDLSAWSSSSE